MVLNKRSIFTYAIINHMVAESIKQIKPEAKVEEGEFQKITFNNTQKRATELKNKS